MPACRSCKADYAAGARWCSICRTNVLNPQVGRLTSPGKRLGACFFDVSIPAVAGVWFYIGLFAAPFSDNGLDRDISTVSTVSAVLLVVYVAVSMILFSKGMTIGKKLLGMRVVKEDGRQAGFVTMLIREWIGKLVSALVLSLGFVWILIDKENQRWHDKLMRTFVVSG